MDSAIQTDISLGNDDIFESKNIIINDLPTEKYHAVNKEYLDCCLENLSWEKTITRFHDPKQSLPKNPENGTRYISTGNGNGWFINRIYEYKNQWFEIIPEKGYIVWIQFPQKSNDMINLDMLYIFNGLTWEKIGKMIDHSDLKNKGINSHQKIDEHIENKRLHLKEDQIDHLKIKNNGIFTHDAIDKHIHNSQTAHFGQDLTKSGIPHFKSLHVSEINMASHVVTKDYVDSKLYGLKWQKEIKEFYDPNDELPINNMLGDRYISLTSGKGWKKNYIYEYDGSHWKETIPMRDYALYVVNGYIYNGDTIVFNGLEWIKFGSVGNHESLRNIGKYTHLDIDSHLNNQTTAHFGQQLSSIGEPTFKNLYINNEIQTEKQVTTQQKIKNHLQIGDFTLPETQKDHSNMTIIGNQHLNTMYVYADSSNDSINTIHLRARGDLYRPQELLKDTPIHTSVFAGHDGESYKVTSTIQCITTEDYSTFGHGSALCMSTTMNNNSIPTMKMKIDHDGSVRCYCTQECVSMNDGAFLVYGGVGIKKNLMVGETLKLGDEMKFHTPKEISMISNDTYPGFDNRIISMSGGGDNGSNRGSSVIVAGNDSIIDGGIKMSAGFPKGNIDFITGDSMQLQINNKGNCIIYNVSDATSESTGSLIVNGGVSIHKNVNIAGSKIHIGTHEETVIATNTQNYNDYLSLNLCGGGDNNIERGSYIKLIGNSNNNNALNGSVIINPGKTTKSQIIFSRNDKHETIVDNDGVWNFNLTNDATSLTTGSLILQGGIGIQKQLYANDIKCAHKLHLPVLSDEPEYNEIGTMYYDEIRDCIRVFTKHGWRNLAFK